MDEARRLRPDTREQPVAFSKGNLVWRPVFCKSVQEYRNKLVLEIDRGPINNEFAAFAGYGVELACHRVLQFTAAGHVMVNGHQHPVFCPQLEEGVVNIQKIGNHVHRAANDIPDKPLYFPRPAHAQNTRIRLSGARDFAYFVAFPQAGESLRVTGNIKDIYIGRSPDTGEVDLREVMEMNVRDIRTGTRQRLHFLMDPVNKSEDEIPKVLQGAIHGEVRLAFRLRRSNTTTPDQDPYYERVIDNSDALGACRTDPAVAIKTVRKASLITPSGNENPYQEVKAMYNINRYHNEVPISYENVTKMLYCAMEDFPPCLPSTTATSATSAAPVDLDSSNNGGLLLSQTNSEGNAYIVMPYYNGGELFDHFEAVSRDYVEIFSCMKNLVQGMKETHSPRYVHRDMSCENVMLHRPAGNSSAEQSVPEPRGSLYVTIDLGMSRHVPEGTMLTDNRVYGKPFYLPPEYHYFYDPKTPYDAFAADVWALGVILYIVLTAQAPFGQHSRSCATYGDWLRSIRTGEIGNVRCNAKPVVVSDHEKGAIASEVLTAPQPPLLRDHPCYNLLRGMLTVSECDRISLERILQDEWVCYGGVSRYIGTHNPVAAAAPAPSAPPAAPLQPLAEARSLAL